MNLSAAPVIYYHSIKYKVNSKWVHPYITMPLSLFQRHMKLIKNLRMKTFFMDDLYKHLNGDKKLPFNSLNIHFDDGYLDNFIFAFPLLKKYNLKATIWVNPEFVDNNDTRIRPTLEDYWDGKVSLDDLNQIDGFLNWEEMKLMEKSGLVEIQSHTMSHTKYPISEKIIDFYSPSTKIDWLHWNLFPDDKPNFFTNPKNEIPLGYPIYESREGNIAKRYEESGELTNELIKFVNDNGCNTFFQNSSWKKNLLTHVTSIKKNKNIIYTQESEEEFRQRLIYELKESKKIIEGKLNKIVNHLCWPFGGVSEKVIKMARECGYLTSTIKGKKNVFNSTESHIVGRIAIDNPKYQNSFFYLYSIYKLFGVKK